MISSIFYVRRVARRPGFTLVELLVVITIIGILAAMVSGALIVARNSARAAATRATIAKLHAIVMAKYESYLTRRLPVETLAPTSAAATRMLALRDLMRMEMPERVSDIFDVDQNGNPVSVRGPIVSGLARPIVLDAYVRRIGNRWSTADGRSLAPAECLYIIVCMACGAEERRQFHESEVGDTNGNGLPEFLDGWGRPIYFLRWAPGFTDSDIQTNVVYQAELDLTNPGAEAAVWTTADVLDRRFQAAANYHDRFDPRQVNMGRPGDNPYVPCGWRLAPLIYSAGPDGEYGIASYPQGTGNYVWTEVQVPGTGGVNVRYYGSDYLNGWGLPVRNSAGDWVHFDNIHNHRIEAE